MVKLKSVGKNSYEETKLKIDKDQNIKISIITVVRNGVPFISETIESVLEQTYKNIEYIVIDGLSNDGTLDIVRAHETSISFWMSERDAGIADAFNKGLRQASGEYIMFLNADDKLAGKDVITEMVSAIHANNFPTLIYGDIFVIDRDTSSMKRRVSIDFSEHALLKGRMFPHPSLLANRRYFDLYGNFDTSFSITMDYEWLLRGAIKETVVHIPVLATYFREGGVSTTNDQRVKDELILALKKNGYISSWLDELKLRIYFYLRLIAKVILRKTKLIS